MLLFRFPPELAALFLLPVELREIARYGALWHAVDDSSSASCVGRTEFGN